MANATLVRCRPPCDSRGCGSSARRPDAAPFLTHAGRPAVEKYPRRRGHSHLGDPVHAVLGNHDTVRMGPRMEAMDIRVLMNESVSVARGSDAIWLAGFGCAAFADGRSVSGPPDSLASAGAVMQAAAGKTISIKSRRKAQAGQLPRRTFRRGVYRRRQARRPSSATVERCHTGRNSRSAHRRPKGYPSAQHPPW